MAAEPTGLAGFYAQSGRRWWTGLFLFSALTAAVVQSTASMKLKLLRFLPLAFIAGTHGFALFAPYAAVVLAALHLRSRQRQRSRARARSQSLPVTPAGMAAPSALVPALAPMPA